MGKLDQTNRSYYQEMKRRCEMLERQIEELKAADKKDATISYLVDLSETCCKAAGMLVDMRTERERTAVTTVPYEDRETVIQS